MNKERLFTAEELEVMGRLTLDLVLASVGTGDKEKTKQLSQRMYNEFLAMHDLYRDWITALLTYIGKYYGDTDLHSAFMETYSEMTMRLGKRYANKTKRQKIQMLIAGLRGHLQPLKIEEDDEKITITGIPCGSGGRLVLDGYYDPPINFLKIQKRRPMTFDRLDFPVYCCHCYFQNIIPTEPGGEPLMITEPAKIIGKEFCRMYVYK